MTVITMPLATDYSNPVITSRTALSGYVLAIADAISEAGLDYRELMEQVGLDHSHLDDFNHRYSQERVTELWKTAVQKTGDPGFGLKVARHIRPSSYHVVGHAMLCSSSPRAAARRFAKFAKLVSDSAIVGLVEKDGCCRLEISLETGGELAAYQAFDTVLAGFLQYCRWILHDELVPKAVYFSHSEPVNTADYQALFQCPIYYQQDCNAIVFDDADMDRPIPGANEELASLLDELATRYLSERVQGRFSKKVREILMMKLPNGEPSRADTAQSLCMTERTLARRLSDENTTFYDILKQVREGQAYGYLKHTDMNIEEIAYLLGFSDRGTFSRAFKNWTGKRPTEWRSEQQRSLDIESEISDQLSLVKFPK